MIPIKVIIIFVLLTLTQTIKAGGNDSRLVNSNQEDKPERILTAGITRKIMAFLYAEMHQHREMVFEPFNRHKAEIEQFRMAIATAQFPWASQTFSLDRRPLSLGDLNPDNTVFGEPLSGNIPGPNQIGPFFPERRREHSLLLALRGSGIEIVTAQKYVPGQNPRYFFGGFYGIPFVHGRNRVSIDPDTQTITYVSAEGGRIFYEDEPTIFFRINGMKLWSFPDLNPDPQRYDFANDDLRTICGITEAQAQELAAYMMLLAPSCPGYDPERHNQSPGGVRIHPPPGGFGNFGP